MRRFIPVLVFCLLLLASFSEAKKKCPGCVAYLADVQRRTVGDNGSVVLTVRSSVAR
jgi:hypothetical protein